ncbi:MAG TPA: TIGR00730 family Rossman fold protein [Myxococcota bacterium]|nr:TIGR00730 family Rossman fold protein [Myxococcales bacterium]HPG25104.1 TIGR00730 family Rossman fold protein [Myxococcota bacterium]
MNDRIEAVGRRVLVFCASSGSCDPVFHAAAAVLGRDLARAGHTIVYGGGAVGSMGALADAALAEGGRVVGIIPRFMREREWAHTGISELQLVDDMQQRKRRMLESADAIVTLPGGSGTFEELFEALTSKRLGLFPKPIVIVNQAGFYDPLFTLLGRSVEERFMHDAHLAMWHAVDRVEDVLSAIEAAAPWPEDAIGFATR